LDRTYWLGLVVTAYACSVLVRAANLPPLAFAAMLPAAAVVAAAWQWGRSAEDLDSRVVRTCLRGATLGLVAAAFGVGAPFDPGANALFAAGAGTAATAGIVALTHAPAALGLSKDLPRRIHHGGALLSALAWTVAAALPLARAAMPERMVDVDLELDARLVGLAALGSLGVLVVTAALELGRRRIELGAGERLRAFLGLAGTILVVGVVGSALRLARAEHLLPAAAATAGAAAAAVCNAGRPERLGRTLALVLSTTTLAVLPAMASGVLCRVLPERAADLAIVGALVSALGALASPYVAARLAPRTEPWAAAFRAATKSAMTPEPGAAVERALSELAGLGRGRVRSPSVYRFDPETHVVVDAAGYTRTEAVTVPRSLADFASEEPHSVLRREVLESVAVRRPEVRGALDWMKDRGLSAVAVLGDLDSPVGLFAVPQGDAEGALGYAEVLALRELADRLGAAIAASAALDRSLTREAEQQRAGTELDGRAKKLESELERERKKSVALARTLAGRVTRLTLSPAARVALDAIERVAKNGQPLALLVPPGVDPLPFVAVFHLASERTGALFVLDGRSRELADLELWRNASESPIALARGGTLVIVAPQALPRLVQAYLGAALDERLGLALVVPRTVDALVAAEVMDERLADAVGDRAVAIPPLSDRSEDLRPTAIDILTRVGLSLRSRPLGIEPAALALLAEHDFPANDVELEAVLVRAAVECTGDVVTRAGLLAAGFAPRAEPESRQRAR
jgi:hypothetical protein